MLVGLLMLGGGVAAGAFGSVLGLGGGVLIVPLLTLGFGLPLREAVGVSLICVIMTSSAAAGVYLERHVANMRLGMTLELFTAIGALVGGSIAFLLSERLLSFLFAVLLLYTAAMMARGRAAEPEVEPGAEPDPRRGQPAPSSRPRRASRPSSNGSRGRATAFATSVAASSGRPAPASSPRSSGSVAGPSRCRSCTWRWGSRCGSPRPPAT